VAGALVAAALLTWVERRLLGFLQVRLGPNRVGPFGGLQWVADMVKMLFKEDWVPAHAHRAAFVLAPAAAVTPVLVAFALLPLFGRAPIARLDVGLLLATGLVALTVYGVLLGAWASGAKYALLGGLRAAAQMLAYEAFFGVALMGVVIQAGSLDLVDIARAQAGGRWFVLPQIVGAVLFAIAGVAATHRLPFDLPESENDLGAGFSTEYSGLKFGLFFVGEYLVLLFVSALGAAAYLGGGDGPLLPPAVWFAVKVGAASFGFVLLRASLPRPTYDQLIGFAWKVCLPIGFLNALVTGAAVVLAGPASGGPS
jgi:NADH-quinone oxidoreductase subunit H